MSNVNSDWRRLAEEKLLKHQRELDKHLPADLQRIFHELQVHQIELEMQNDELRRTQLDLQASREKYFDRYDLAPVGYLSLNEKGLIMETNVTAAALLGEERSDLVRQPLSRFIFREDKDFYYLCHKRLVETLTPQMCEMRMVRKDGTPFWVRIDINTVQGIDDTTGTRVVIIDVTERKKIEKLLKAKDKLLVNVLDSMPDYIFVKDTELRTILCNKACADAIGKKPKDLIMHTDIENGWDPELVKGNPAKGIRGFENDDLDALSGKVVHNPNDPTNMGNEIRFFDTHKLPLYDEDNKIFGLLGIARDITDRKKAEDALRYAKAFTETTLKAIDDIFYAFDLNGKLLMWNKALGRVTGYSDEELYSMTATDFFEGEDIKRISKTIETVFKDGHSKQEAYLVLKNRRQIPYEFTGSVIKDNNGNISGFSGIGRDITERTKAEEKLRESEFNLVAAQHLAHIGSWEWDIVANTAWWSDETYRIFGQVPGDLEEHRQHFLDMIHPGDKCKVDQALTDALNGTGKYDLEYRIIMPDKTERTIHALAEVIWGYDGKPARMRGTVRDITEGKRVEEELNAVTQRLKLATQSANLGIWDWDISNNDVVWDERMLELYGLTKETFSGGIEAWQNGLHPEDRDRAIQECQAALRSQKQCDTEFRVLHPSGTVKHLKGHGIVIRDSEGNPVRMLGINYDITEHRNLEEQLSQSRKMEAIGTLAGGVAHDFNNILTAIIGFGTMAKKRLEEGNKTKEFIEEIIAGANRAADLTRALLAFSRKQVISPKPKNLNEIIGNMEKMLRRIIKEDIEFTTVLSDKVIIVMVDAAQMDQVLLNLTTNACDAMPGRGHLTIATDVVNVDGSYAEAHLFEQTGKYAVLTISDTGIGMDPKARENIFEPFFTTKEVGKGTGLGLAKVYGIIKQHGGNISVSSEPGKGSTFRIYLPVLQAENQEAKKDATSAPQGKGETILIAEDDEMLRRILTITLAEYGYKVVEAVNGEEAAKKFIENRDTVALVLLDVIMPVKNGREAYEEIEKFNPVIKAIFMSGYTDDILAKNGILEEGFDFMSKPIIPDVLMRKIREVLDR